MTEQKEQGIIVSPLFAGLTRPATMFGLPLNAFVVNMLVMAILFFISKNIFVIFLGIPMHFILRIFTNKDIYVFDNLKLQGITKGKCRKKELNSVTFSNANIRKIKSNNDYKEF